MENIYPIISYVFAAIAGISAIKSWLEKLEHVEKYTDIAMKFTSLSVETIEMVDAIAKATKDGVLTADEIKKIAAEYDSVKEAFKKVRGK
jgi:hypothetical protein